MKQIRLQTAQATSWKWAEHLVVVSNIDALPPQVEICWIDAQDPDWPIYAARLKTQGINTVLVSAQLSLLQLQHAFSLGIKGYCDTNISTHTAGTIAVTIAHQGLWVPNHLLAAVVGNLAALPQYQRKALPAQVAEALTTREKMVTNLILEGCSNQQIGHQLTITERTVKQHISTILKKFAVRDRVALLLKLGQFRKLD